jgi:hypothetical protein
MGRSDIVLSDTKRIRIDRLLRRSTHIISLPKQLNLAATRPLNRCQHRAAYYH